GLQKGAPHRPGWGGAPPGGGPPGASPPLDGGVSLACDREKPVRKSSRTSSPMERNRSLTLLEAVAVVPAGGSIKNQSTRYRTMPMPGGSSARITNTTRTRRGSTPKYTARPEQTPPTMRSDPRRKTPPVVSLTANQLSHACRAKKEGAGDAPSSNGER